MRETGAAEGCSVQAGKAAPDWERLVPCEARTCRSRRTQAPVCVFTAPKRCCGIAGEAEPVSKEGRTLVLQQGTCVVEQRVLCEDGRDLILRWAGGFVGLAGGEDLGQALWLLAGGARSALGLVGRRAPLATRSFCGSGLAGCTGARQQPRAADHPAPLTAAALTHLPPSPAPFSLTLPPRFFCTPARRKAYSNSEEAFHEALREASRGEGSGGEGSGVEWGEEEVERDQRGLAIFDGGTYTTGPVALGERIALCPAGQQGYPDAVGASACSQHWWCAPLAPSRRGRAALPAAFICGLLLPGCQASAAACAAAWDSRCSPLPPAAGCAAPSASELETMQWEDGGEEWVEEGEAEESDGEGDEDVEGESWDEPPPEQDAAVPGRWEHVF